ncbi:hypothetical protein OE88DRAFT_1733898 [Heliocybe sulcata]|uniref:F-box domain-containing protein n=1 Tax=Heliocybe sulcata TaxID=5364 RepID=A0A5C3N5H8_9AGAM|nr:hypothetical protein OE88DRAFT_1733898 [Heliocybe sulcata]
MHVLDLPYDILCCIFRAVPDTATLLASLRVCRTFSEAALPCVYAQIVFDDGYKGRMGRAFRAIEARPHLRGYVRGVQHVATDMYIDPAQFSWAEPLSKLHSLTSYTLSTPQRRLMQFVSLDFLTVAIHALAQCPNLRHIRFDFHLTTSYFAVLYLLAALPRLRSVSFGRPSALFFVRLVPWLRAMPHLDGLHMMDMTELTVERLQAVLPEMANVTHLTLGPNHTFSSTALLAVLESLPQLLDLTVYYYNFPDKDNTTHPPSQRLLPVLHTLAVHHQDVTSASDFSALFTWLWDLCRHSPLRALEITSVDCSICDNPDELLEFVRAKEATLRHVAARHVYVKRDAATWEKSQDVQVVVV